MLLALEPSLKEKIEKQYEEWMACCPNKKREIDAWIKSADEDEAVCMKYLYAYMHPCDIVSYDVEVIASYVKATLDMYANVPYAKKVPAELFFTYVLCVRVNNEDLDKSREWIYRQLVDRVKDKKTMVEAALEVNYWCYEKATYIPSDGHTVMTTMHGLRCGQMAIGIILEHVSQNQYLIRVGLLQLHQRQCLFMQRHFQTWKALQK